MTTRISFIYETPLDPAEFETNNRELLRVARAIPGFQRVETSRSWRTSITKLLGRIG